MAVRIRHLVGLAVLLTVWLHGPRPLAACGPFFPDTIFTYTAHPDPPLEQFVRGRLGVLQPAYAWSYLYVAYRHLAGIGFDQEEQRAVQTLWDKRLKMRDPYWDDQDAALKEWIALRNAVVAVGPAPRTGTHRQSERHYFFYLNCSADAYRTAARTLRARVDRFGAASREVAEWTRGQDAVFANCSKGRAVPDPAPRDLDPLIQADRAYQIAAAHFYAGEFGEAEQRFRVIARDATSPWAVIAPYLVARTLVRKATLGAPPERTDVVTLAQAEAQLVTVLADPRLADAYPAARKLLNFIRARLRPSERVKELGLALVTPGSGSALEQDLDDYTFLLDRVSGQSPDELTDWLRTFKKGGHDHAVQRWEQTSSLPWLVASLTWIDTTHPKLPALLEAARRVPAESPAFAAVTYHRLRLTVDAGRTEEARQELDTLVSRERGRFPVSSLNLLLALRMKLARSLDEFLKYAPRVPAGIDLGPTEWLVNNDPQLKAFADGRSLLDADSIRVLNALPLGRLRDAAKNPAVPLHLRRELALAAWVRAVLLEDDRTSRELARVVSAVVQEGTDVFSAYLPPQDAGARKFAAAFAILKFPGLRPYLRPGVSRLLALDQIDGYRDNWWCALDLDKELILENYWKLSSYERNGREGKPVRRVEPPPADYPAFLTESEKRSAREEWKKLLRIPTAPNYLTREVLDRARKSPDDPRLPEALHLAVRSTRYGCTEDDTSKLSKAAFQLLHRRYPRSPWAEQTKYWY